MTVEDLRFQLLVLHDDSTVDAWSIIAAAIGPARPPHRQAMLEWVVLGLRSIWYNPPSAVPQIAAALLMLYAYPHALPALISQLVGSVDPYDRYLALDLVAAIHTEPYAPDPHAYDDLLLPLLADERDNLCFDTGLLLWRSHPVLVREMLDGLCADQDADHWRQRLAEAGRDRTELDGATSDGDGSG